MREPSVCGIVFCFNEEQILRHTLTHYLSQGFDLVIFDNCSTDSSPDIVEELRSRNAFAGAIVDVVRVETNGYEWQKMLEQGGAYMRDRLGGYEWLALIDADAFYRSPVRSLSLRGFMAEAERRGYNVLDGRLIDFFPTDRDDPDVESPLERLRYCRLEQYGRLSQHKLFRNHPGIEFHSTFGHECHREGVRVCPVRFLYHHYGWVSLEHGMRKLFRDRKPRYVERIGERDVHWQYGHLLPVASDVVKDPESLWLYDEDRLLISAGALSWPRARIGAHARGLRATLEDGLETLIKHAKRFRLMFGYDRRRALDFAGAVLRDAIGGGTELEARAHYLPPVEALELKPYVWEHFPRNYHFLLTNFCNVDCVFCNQRFDVHRGASRQITLDAFKTMTANIPELSGAHFYLSGGGDPLLCRDLIPIIRYTNQELPGVRVHIRTNGALLKDLAEQLRDLDVHQLEVSVHGASSATDDAIFQRRVHDKIFEGIAEITKAPCGVGRVMLCPTVSKRNIHEIPDLVARAKELAVDEVAVTFMRFYPNHGPQRLDPADSLFFHQDLYDDTMRKARRLAGRLSIEFDHEPLFAERRDPKPCLQPWEQVVVDWEGDIYPCTGGEVWFHRKVKKREYDFGNLLSGKLPWNADWYVRVRRTCDPSSGDEFVPECRACHNTLCLQGPGRKEGHMIREFEY